MPDASLVLQRYRVFFLAFLKLHFPELNTTHRADVTTKQTTHTFLGITMRCAGFLAPFHRLVTAVVTGNITASTANTFIKIDTGIDNIYSAAIFLIPICISFDTAEKRRYATYLILNRRFSFEF